MRIEPKVAASGRVFSEQERYARWLYNYSGTAATEERRRLHCEYMERIYLEALSAAGR
jgi:hypothetical protein